MLKKTNNRDEPRVKLTLDRIRAAGLPAGKQQDIPLWDTEVTQLGVRVTVNKKAFIFQSRIEGQSIRVTIGDVNDWTIEAARIRGRELQREIDLGRDPRLLKVEQIAANKAKREENERNEVLVRTAWEDYVEDMKESWSARHLADHETMVRAGGADRKRGPGQILAGPLSALMPFKLQDLTKDVVKEWLKRENAQRATRAALAYRLLRAFIKWCGRHDDYSAVVQLTAVSTDISNKHVKRAESKDDCILREQLFPWFASVRKLENPVQSTYLQTLLLVGARREEWAGVTWENVDFQWKRVRIRDKVEGERVIPLTPYVAVLLNALPRRNEFVFSSARSDDGRMQEPRIAHNRALADAALPHLTLHGLRRSFATMSEWAEAPAGVVAQIMGHKPSAIAEKHYKKRPVDLLAMWHVKIEKWILEQAGIEQPSVDAAPIRLVKAA